jgi:hypothetical protein
MRTQHLCHRGSRHCLSGFRSAVSSAESQLVRISVQAEKAQYDC